MKKFDRPPALTGDFANLDRIATPGKDTRQALSAIRAEAFSIFPGIRDADWAAIQAAVLTSDPLGARADLVQDMLRLAVAARTMDFTKRSKPSVCSLGLAAVEDTPA
jgi:hypothetical protein